MLHVLAGRNRFSGAVDAKVEGSILINGKVVELNALEMSRDQNVAFVSQEDYTLLGVTPREAIRFSARLRLPRSVTEEDISSLVDKLLIDLLLDHLGDRPLHGLTSLSGGERRRVALGIELVTRPSILILDEVTSGEYDRAVFAVNIPF